MYFFLFNRYPLQHTAYLTLYADLYYSQAFMHPYISDVSVSMYLWWVWRFYTMVMTNQYFSLSVVLLFNSWGDKINLMCKIKDSCSVSPGGRHFSWLLDSLRCRRDLSRPISGQRSWRALLLRSNDCSLARFPIAGDQTTAVVIMVKRQP